MLTKFVVLTPIILTISSFKTILTINEDCDALSADCQQQSNCRDCVRRHHCCVWCYDENFKGSRCNIQNATELSACEADFIEQNDKTESRVEQNLEFRNVELNTNEAVQLRPQQFHIKLRHGEPVNISVEYRPAKNYPLDLYYLMDLTFSMRPDLDTITTLGSELSEELKMLTTNYGIAFGSYIDKPTTPFYNEAPVYRETPCDDVSCEMGYSFRHRLNFTNDTEMFSREVGKSDISANLDNLEGGFDALMQVMFCRERLHWSKNSRKLVLIATDGLMHFAGDGLLAGYTRRNRELCLIDDSGNYISLIPYDYPSLEETHRELKRMKINLIVAAKESVLPYYERLDGVLNENLFVGKLEKNSTNILNLVKLGYYDFVRQVSLFTNASNTGNLDVKFFADCKGDGRWEQKGNCDNAQVGKAMNFKVQLQSKEFQTGNTILHIEESNIYETILLNITYVGSDCKCPLRKGETVVCEHGINNCGECICDIGWSGKDCAEQCKNDLNLCRSVEGDYVSLTCKGRGDCICGKCECRYPYIQGKFCEFECPYNHKTQQICEGHGTCSNGTCRCEREYVNDDCSCHNSTENCKIPGSDQLCSDKGGCTCNKCDCESGFSGQYCEYCKECVANTLCGEYDRNVFEFVENNKRNNETGPLRIEIVDRILEEERYCVYRYTRENGQKCDIQYSYAVSSDVVQVEALQPKCNSPARAGFVAIWIVGAFVALGFLIILVWKGRNYCRDRREYAKFVKDKERSMSSEQNPLYKSPVVTYNPRETIEMQSKSP